MTSIVEPGDAESTLLGRIILFLVRFLLALFASSPWRLELFAVELLQASRNSIGVPGRIFFRFSMVCWILYLCFRVQVNESRLRSVCASLHCQNNSPFSINMSTLENWELIDASALCLFQ